MECDDVWVLIAGTAGMRNGGVPAPIDWFDLAHDIPAANVKYYQYGSSSGTGEATNPQGTSMAVWTSTDNKSGTMGVYMSSTAPRLWIEFRRDDDGTVKSALSWGNGVAPRRR